MPVLTHCSSCTWNRPPIQGNGPKPCRLMFLGEGPARDEVRLGFPFAGRSGQEYDLHYLPLAGLQRREVYVSNVRKCPSPGFRNPTAAEALDCARRHLPAELEQVRPEVVVTMGSVAASVFDTTHPPGSLGRPVDLETDYGFPTRASFRSWTGWLVPQYHPAAGMHQPRFIQALREGFSALGPLLHLLLDKDDWRDVLAGRSGTLAEDPYPNPDYGEIRDLPSLYAALSEWEPYQEIAVDTERDGDKPWSLQFCLRPGTGRLIDASRRDLVCVFAGWVRDRRPVVVFHHALNDLDTLLDFDPPVRVPRWVDTMMLAYHAQVFSHGLKPLAYRRLGMLMEDYDDVVTPHSIDAVYAHAVDIIIEIESRFQAPHVFKSGKRKGQSEPRFLPGTDPGIRAAYNRYTALARDIQSPSRPAGFDPWKRWAEWSPEVRAWGEALASSPFPGKSIAHVPREEAVWYACRDADATLRLLPLVRRLCARMGDGIMIQGGN